MKTKHLCGAVVLTFALVFVWLILLKGHPSIPVAFSLPDGANYEMGSICLLKWSEEETAVMDKGGATISLGKWMDVSSRGGVLFCKDESGKTFHFALNGCSGGVWVDDQDFFDERPVVTSFRTASLIPQKDKGTGKLGYLNHQMLWIVPPKYQVSGELEEEWNQCFIDGTAFPTLTTEHGERICMLSENGVETVLHIQEGEPSEQRFQDGFCLFRRKNFVRDPETGLYQDTERCNFLSKDNIVLIKNSQYDDAHDFSEGYAAVHTDMGWGYIDTTGQEILPCIYNGAGDFHEGKAVVSTKAGGVFFIDAQGNPLGEPISAGVYEGKEGGGLYCVSDHQKGMYLINSQGKLIANQQLCDYEWDEEGGVWYASSRNGRYHDWLITPEGVKIHNEDNVLFQVYRNRCIAGENGADILYDLKTGRKLFSAPVISGFREGLSYAGSGKYGYIDMDGNWIIPPVLPQQKQRYISSAGESFWGGLTLANYNGQNVMLYNPLIYKEGWETGEFERAVSLGLGNAAMDEDILTSDQLLTLVDNFQDFVRSHLEDGVFPETPMFRPQAEYLVGAGRGRASREELAVCLCRLAEDLGKNTQNYAGFYADQDSITYPREVNYIASLSLFDVENNTFDPRRDVSQREAAILFLRFTEAML